MKIIIPLRELLTRYADYTGFMNNLKVKDVKCLTYRDKDNIQVREYINPGKAFREGMIQEVEIELS